MPVPVVRKPRRLPHSETLVFGFWALQSVLWLGMMFYVQIFNQHLGDSVLYVTQISHWALVETAAVAAYANWLIRQERHRQRHAHDEEKSDG